MILALTYDHRLIDGREAVTFLMDIKRAIEDPRVMLLDVWAVAQILVLKELNKFILEFYHTQF